jgi:predicted transposase YdaD
MRRPHRKARPKLKQSLWHNIEVLEEQEKMRYVTSVEQIGIEKGLLQGRLEGEQSGEAKALRRLLQKRFGPLSEDVLARLQTASIDELELWLDRALDADSLAGVFSQ